MGRIFLGSVAVVCLLVVFGCAAGTATMSTANLTYPVNVGPVKHIKGKPLPAQTCKSQSAFVVKAENSYSYFGGGYTTQVSSSKEGQNKFDVELMKYSIDGKDMVFNINHINYGSYQGGWFWAIYEDKSWIGIDGNICRLD